MDRKTIDRVTAALASLPTTTPDLLVLLAESLDEETRQEVAANANTPVDVLDQLAKDREDIVRLSVAVNKNAKPETLVQLATDLKERVRRAVAQNPSTPLDVRKTLIRTGPDELSEYLAEDQETDANLLEYLYEEDDGIPVVRRLAENPSTPNYILSELSEYEDSTIRESAAKNPHLPSEALKNLLNDPFAPVRKAVLTHPKVATRIARLKIDPGTRLSVEEEVAKAVRRLGYKYEVTDVEVAAVSIALAKSIQTAPELLALLSKSKFSLPVECVAENPNTPPSTLKRLAFSIDAEVRTSVAKNSSTPPSFLTALALDRVSEVRIQAELNPMMPLHDLLLIAPKETEENRRLLATESKSETVLETLFKADPTSPVSQAFVHNPVTPSSILSALSKSEDIIGDYWVRACVAKHPNTTLETLTDLLDDPFETVRVAVFTNPKVLDLIASELNPDTRLFVEEEVGDTLEEISRCFKQSQKQAKSNRKGLKQS